MTPLQTLRNNITKANNAYHRPGGTPIVTDQVYDQWKRELKALAPTDSLLTSVGVQYNREELATKVKHNIPMGSLDNTDNGILGVRDWYAALVEELDSLPDLYISWKADGSSIGVDYLDNKLVRAVTRGNGSVGEDVTANAALFRNLPLELTSEPPFTGTVRGEAILSRADFNQLMAGKPIDEISNPRNVGNGIIGRDDGSQSEFIAFYAFNIVPNGEPPFSTEAEKFDYLTELGFTVMPGQLLENENSTLMEQVEAYHDDILARRNTLPFDIDGLVITINEIALQDHFLTSDIKSRLRPKYARAIKLPSFLATTTVTGVTVTVGHRGSIVPTLDVARVRCGGIFVDSVVVTNYDTIVNYDIAVGDEVTVMLAGDIIPNLGGVVSRPVNRVPIPIPTNCPSCGSP